MKTNKVLKRMLTVLLSAAVFISSTSTIALAMELEVEDTLSVDTIIEEAVSENSIVEETDALDGTVSEDTVLVNSVSEDATQSDADEPLLDEISEIVAPDGALKAGDSITFKFYVGEDGWYSETPSGYAYNGVDAYETCVIVTNKNASFQLLSEPWTPDNKYFIGWESEDGKWLVGGIVPLSFLKKAKAGSTYTFKAVFKDYFIYYDSNGGSISVDAPIFIDPAHLDGGADGINEGEQFGYKLLSSAYVVPKEGYSSFEGWSARANGSIVQNLADFDFQSRSSFLEAVWGNAATLGSIVYCDTFDGIEKIHSISEIPSAYRLPVKGGVDTYTADTGEITPVPLSTPSGKTFIGWTIYSIADMSPSARLNSHVKSFDLSYETGDLVFVANWYDEPGYEDHNLTLTGLTGIDQDSLSALEAQGFTVKGDTATKTFTSTDNKFYLPALSKPGSSFLGWYETGKSPSTASPYVEFDPATSYDVGYTASFQEDVSISLRSSLTLYEGQSFSLSATVRPKNVVQTVTWTNSDSEVVSLTGSMVKAIKAGTCKITATSVADPSKKAVCKVTVLKSEVTETDEHGNPIDPGSHAYDEETGEMNIWVAGIDKDGYHYTGNAIEPEIHVYNGGKLLREGTDYTLSYKNNVNVSTKASTKKPQVIIKMKGQYLGAETVYFDILPTPLSELTATESNLDVTYQLQKKNQIKPVLEYKGTKIKYSKKDLSFKWFETDSSGNATEVESPCIDPGSYAVKVYPGTAGNFIGNESGYQMATVNVLGKIPISAVKVNGFKSKVPYNNGAAIEQPEMTLTYKSGKTLRTLILGEDYTVSYDNNYNVGTATVTYEGMKDSSGNYTGDFAGKITKKYQITGKYTLDSSNTTVTLAEDSYEFQNAAIEPAVTVTVTAMDDNGNPENRTLVNGKDYTVTYKNNKAVAAKDAVNSKGKDIAPQVIIKGKGNYATSKQGMVERFNITKTELSSLVLTISDKPYSNKAGGYKSPKIVFTDRNYRDLKLKEGKDYTVTCATSDGSETPAPGQIVYVAINAKEGSSYTGNIAGEYRITGPMYTDIGKAKVVVNPNSNGKTTACAYTGSKIEPGQTGQPGLVLTTGSGKRLKTLTQGIDYEIVSYHNNVSPSKCAYVIVRGLGDYRGVRAVKFTISARPVASHWGGVFGL